MTFNKEYVGIVVILLLLAFPLAYGVSFIIPFTNAYALFSCILIPSTLWYTYTKDQETTLVNAYKEKLEDVESRLVDAEVYSDELETVVKNYEVVFSKHEWEIPCNCGENTFVGLFSPYVENICTCEKCKNSYKITLNYESILMTEPMNNEEIFDSLKTRIESELVDQKESV